jgi:altronate hydrolase
MNDTRILATMKKVLKIHPEDNVLVALTDLNDGEVITYEGKHYLLKTDVPAKHKFVMHNIQPGDPIMMYGVIVGKAMQFIQTGEIITTENVSHDTDRVDPVRKEYDWKIPNVDKWQKRTFLGYHRSDGKVGTANYWIVAPLVFCENRNIEVIRESMLRQLGYADIKSQALDIEPLVKMFQQGVKVGELKNVDLLKFDKESRARVFDNIDGIKFLTHSLGCGGTRKDAHELCELIAGYIANPNVAGATIIGLGCQNAEQKFLEDAIAKRDPKRTKPVFFHEQQKSQSEKVFLSEVIKSIFTGLIEANKVNRSPAPLRKLIVGLECGGSDGFSGISANPALGYASDIINALGGATILSEFPELHGVEQELFHRCRDDQLAHRFFELMGEYARRAEMLGSGFEANPSPGNIRDGLITDAMKSAGAAKKGGSAPVTDVLDYTAPVVQNGLNLLCTPGNDVESTTAMAGSGANIIVFTTGLGTPTGNPIAPVVKVSSNTELFDKMGDIIDVNAGAIIDGDSTIEEIGEEILDFIIKVASGEIQTKAQLLGQDDFIPWKRDISL